jgi:glutathione synthase/RimK-type ligase-like ATP-grasp enzyme
VVDVRLVSCADLPAPDPDTPILAAALEQRGATVDVRNWRDTTVDWAGARLTMLRSPWDYVDSVDEFVAWVQRAAAQTAFWNPAALVAWNVHKSYLLDLAERGAPIVPTVVLLRGSAAALDGIADAQGWNTLVVKPAVGVGAIGAGRFDVGDARAQAHLDELLAAGDVLVQPFVSSISTGEISVVLVDGRTTHAIRKRPAAGDYRVQENYGGDAALVDDPPAAPVELAERVVEALPGATLYARVDMLQIGAQWHVLEVEVTEPSLWLDLAPSTSAESLADATIARLA